MFGVLHDTQIDWPYSCSFSYSFAATLCLFMTEHGCLRRTVKIGSRAAHCVQCRSYNVQVGGQRSSAPLWRWVAACAWCVCSSCCGLDDDVTLLNATRCLEIASAGALCLVVANSSIRVASMFSCLA